jgi:type IX secretion system PorP/SprF family membrane protein
MPLLVFGQQQVMYTQYMFNGLAINPAYAGTSEALSITALGRWQWVGIEGAPTTQTLSAHTPIEGKNIGVGLTLTRDEIAVTKETGVYASYAYRLHIGSGFLSMGLQGGFSTLKGNYNDVYTLSPDPMFQGQSSHFLPNIGAGLFYYNAVFYAGVSAPLLMENNIKSGGVNVYKQARHYFLTSGMIFNLSRGVKVKPNILLKFIEGVPISVDYNVNFLFSNVIWLGVSYRAPESVNFIGEINISKNFRIGYAYDHIIQNTLRTATSSSHEVMLNYRISLKKRGVVTPRYF